MILADEDCKRLTIVVTAPVEVIDRVVGASGKYSVHLRALLTQLSVEIRNDLDDINVKFSVVEIPKEVG